MSNINKMLIDATHSEETRVVVLKNGRVEEFDFESAARKLLRGNIYLAKVTRVEPALQAAFIDYGGNRHGFLAFNEIHPDYYQIPVADRQALLEEEAAQEAAEEAEVDAHAERLARRRQRDGGREEGSTGDAGHSDQPSGEVQFVGEGEDVGPPEVLEGGDASHHDDGGSSSHAHDHGSPHAHGDEPEPRTAQPVHASHDDRIVHSSSEDLSHPSGVEPSPTVDGTTPEGHVSIAEPSAEVVEAVGMEDVVEEMPQRPRRRPRSYKIQEVIKRRQVILVQVVKEERGNKGAALTTYLSLAGRYTVLMPNTARGGGISRKITQPGDRKRLKAIANELEVPEGMGLIIRTAGASRTSQEIKRDFEYLLRLWESVRELTLASTAPSLVYEEGNLIKRSIRDLYTKEVEEVVVAGEVAHREARDFMRMLMPSHAQNVIEYKGLEPLFTRYRMEQQLAAMFSPQVTLKSGGYLVINQTEALVAVDVNSGKSTREYSIEETALQTNLEAADELARQVKLRDLAGLIVIDFIDMEEKRNNRAVERRLKDALRFDRARIQLGRISHFGLMEMSRQRLRTGVLEGSTSQCPHCQGTGIIRSIESVALAVLRGLEDTLMSGTRMALVVTTTPQVALYILNAKRAYVTDMEARHGLAITIQGSDKLQGANFTIDKVMVDGADPALRRRSSSAVNMEWGFEGEGNDPPALAVRDDLESGDGFEPDIVEVEGEGPGAPAAGAEGGRRRRRGRRNRRDERPVDGAVLNGRSPEHGGRAPLASGVQTLGEDEPSEADDQVEDLDRESPEAGSEVRVEGETEGEGRARRSRRRGRRGGRRGGRDRAGAPGEADGLTAGTDEGPAVAHHAETFDNGHAAHAHSHAEPSQIQLTAELVAVRPEPAAHAAGADRVGEPTRSAPRERAGSEEVHSQSATPVQPDTQTSAKPMAAKVSAPTPHIDLPKSDVASAPPITVVTPPTPAPEPVALVTAMDSPKPRRVASTSSEPVLERVTVSPLSLGASLTDPESEPTAKPVRKGWWQRKLGLD